MNGGAPVTTAILRVKKSLPTWEGFTHMISFGNPTTCSYNS